MVIKNNVVKSPNSLIELRAKCLTLRNKFNQICPLQHHGIMAYTSYDLQNYRSSFIPINALEDSLEFFSKKPIQFNINTTAEKESKPGLGRIKYIYNLTIEALNTGVFNHHPYKGIGLMAEYENYENCMRQLFWFLGTIMTMPAYLLTGINQSTSKRKSFSLAKPIYSNKSWSLIEDATKIRYLWGMKEKNKYIGNEVPNWLIKDFDKSYMKRFSELLYETIKIIESYT